METRQGKIEEKFLKFATNKAAYATFIIGGFKYNTFDQKIIDEHNPGDFVEMTGEMKGKFWTMATMKKIDEPTPGFERKEYKGEFKNGAKEYHLSPEEVKCRALECALNCRVKAFELNQSLFGTDKLLALANTFVKWIRNGN